MWSRWWSRLSLWIFQFFLSFSSQQSQRLLSGSFYGQWNAWVCLCLWCCWETENDCFELSWFSHVRTIWHSLWLFDICQLGPAETHTHQNCPRFFFFFLEVGGFKCLMLSLLTWPRDSGTLLKQQSQTIDSFKMFESSERKKKRIEMRWKWRKKYVEKKDLRWVWYMGKANTQTIFLSLEMDSTNACIWKHWNFNSLKNEEIVINRGSGSTCATMQERATVKIVTNQISLTKRRAAWIHNGTRAEIILIRNVWRERSNLHGLLADNAQSVMVAFKTCFKERKKRIFKETTGAIKAEWKRNTTPQTCTEKEEKHRSKFECGTNILLLFSWLFILLLQPSIKIPRNEYALAGVGGAHWVG